MQQYNNTLIIPDNKGGTCVDIGSIVRIEALSNYSKLFMAGGRTLVVTKVLKQFEEILAGKGFTRIHRSHLVNNACIQAYNLYHMKIKLDNKEQLSISRRKSAVIRKQLSSQREAYLQRN